MCHYMEDKCSSMLYTKQYRITCVFSIFRKDFSCVMAHVLIPRTMNKDGPVARNRNVERCLCREGRYTVPVDDSLEIGRSLGHWLAARRFLPIGAPGICFKRGR